MITLALAYLRDRPLTTALNVLLLAISVAMLVLLLQLGNQASERLQRDADGVDLVVGSKGSPLQLILSSVFHVDEPTGNIPLSSLELLRTDPAVERAVPLALGDNFRGFRIVGSDASFYDLYGLELAQGARFDGEMQAVLGAEVARATGAQLGQQFVGSHGFGLDEDGAHAHDNAPYETVGILAPSGTVADRLILVSYQSVWEVHGITHDHDHDQVEEGPDHKHRSDGGNQEIEHDHSVNEHEHGIMDFLFGHDHEGHDHGEEGHQHDGHDHEGHDNDHNHSHEDHDHDNEHQGHDHDGHAEDAAPILQAASRELEPELTALLVTYRNASGAVRIPAMINRQTEMQAAVPANETARLLELVGASLDGMRVFAWLLAATGGLAIFVALLNMARSREGDLALLRVMGASKEQVFATVILEGVITAALGAVAGWIGAHGLIALARANFATLSDLGLSAFAPVAGEGLLVLAVLGIGALAALIPALRVYRIDPAQVLARSGS
ncbi:MAG: FtsX-like permease family protein [Pseudomonadota bacterium]